ncbi:MAG: tetratricopeptide (TPR) repeat protein [Gammaproteobacteria bacterium]|jgi:tetratricopeptide (TPR) repeat protein
MLFLTLYEQINSVILYIPMNMSIKTSSYKLIIALLCAFAFSGIAIANAESEDLFNSGLAHFEDEKYSEAIKKLEIAVEIEPQVAEYHHVLAKSYGREAEKTNWFKAISYAKKTLAHLEIAAELDSQNIDILDDLMDYYREAPGFLGGDTKKANKIEDLINKISVNEKLAKFE